MGNIENMAVFDLWVLMDKHQPPNQILILKANIKIINSNHGREWYDFVLKLNMKIPQRIFL